MKVGNRFEAMHEKENDEVEFIRWREEETGGQATAKREIVGDSGAAESVCPWDWALGPAKELSELQRRAHGAFR